MLKNKEKEEEKPVVAKTAVDLQRLKLLKLMKNPEKPVIIPERPKVKSTPTVPEFVRNVMGSSAGAGSGEFHVYRHLRRKEYARQKFIQEKGQKELLDEEYHRKIEENKRHAEELTAKKRAKRLKKKEKLKQKKRKKFENVGQHNKLETNSLDEESSDEEETNVKDDGASNEDKHEDTSSTNVEEEQEKNSVDQDKLNVQGNCTCSKEKNFGTICDSEVINSESKMLEVSKDTSKNEDDVFKNEDNTSGDKDDDVSKDKDT